MVVKRIEATSVGRWLAAAMFAGAAAWCSAPAWAANASDLSTTLTSIPSPSDSVSVSRQNLTTFIAYRVQLGNTGGNTINQVILKGTATTLPAGNPAAAFSSVVVNSGIAPSCGPVGGAVINCTIGQMKAGKSSDFFLLFSTPASGSSLSFRLETTFSEGNSASSPPANITQPAITLEVPLDTTVADGKVNNHVTTVLPPAGGSFFTGFDNAVNATNPFSTKVTLPGVTNLVTVNRIDQTRFTSFACATGYFCYGLTSQMNVDNAAITDPLADPRVFYDTLGKTITIILRQDVSSLSVKNPIPKIGDVKIFYNPNNPQPNPGDPYNVGTEVPACGPGLPARFQPCISKRIDNIKGNKGYYEFDLLSVDNGWASW